MDSQAYTRENRDISTDKHEDNGGESYGHRARLTIQILALLLALDNVGSQEGGDFIGTLDGCGDGGIGGRFRGP